VAALAVVAGCAGHPPVELSAGAANEDGAGARAASEEHEHERCIPREVTDEIRCAGHARRAAPQPGAQPPDPTVGARRGRVVRRRAVDLAPEQAWVPPAPSAAPGTPARSEQQVRAAIVELKGKLAAPGSGTAGRPRLLRDLADAHVELANQAFRRKVEGEVGAASRKEPRRAAAARAQAAQADRDMRGARAQAIAYYDELLRQHPSWCATPTGPPDSHGCADEILHLLSFEHEQQGNGATALRLSREIIARFPHSKYLSNAHLAVGEQAFSEAATDPAKWKEARRAYERVIAAAPARNPLASYGRYKLAYVFWNLSDFPRALAQMARVVELGQQPGASANAKTIAKSARRDLIPLYALGGKPAQAYPFFKPLSGDRGAREEQTLAMMRALGQNLSDVGRYGEAIGVYRDLLQRTEGDHVCDDQAAVTFALMAQGASRTDLAAALKVQLTSYLAFQRAKHPLEARVRCARTTGTYLLETAMKWHAEVLASNSAAVMDQTAGLYRLVIDHFTAEQLATFDVSLVEQGGARMAAIRYAHADLLYFQKKWDECGPAFDRVLDEPTAADPQEAAFAAVLCYANALGLQRSGVTSDSRPKELGGRPLGPAQQRLFVAFERYVCEFPPPGGDLDAQERWVEAKHARARAYFQVGRFQRAAAAFRQVAIDHADADGSIDAALEYVESLNVLAGQVPRPQPLCFNDLERDLPILLELHCTGAKLRDNEEECAQLHQARARLADAPRP